MPSIISVASGKGGVGKSMVVSNLGLLLAQKGHRVILVDMDIGGTKLHILFGMFHTPSTLTDFFSNSLKNLNEIAHPIANLSSLKLIPGTGETLITANLQHAKKNASFDTYKNLTQISFLLTSERAPAITHWTSFSSQTISWP